MMAGHGGDNPAVGGPARHIPVLLAEVIAALEPRAGRDDRRRHVRRGRLYQGDAGGRRDRSSRIDRDPDAIAAGRELEAASGGRLTAGARAVLASRRLRRTGRRRRARHRRFVDADRRGRARLLLPRRRAARHAHGAGGPERRRRRQPLQVGRPRPHLRLPRRGAACRPHRPDDREAAARNGRSSARSTLPTRSRRMSGASPKDKIHPATRVFQALRIFVNDELGELAGGAVRGRAGAEARRPAGGGDVPFAGRPHRQALHRRPFGQGRRLAPPAGGAGQGRDLREARRRRSRPAKRRPRPIRARARPSCGPPCARTRRPRGRRFLDLRPAETCPKSGFRQRGEYQCFVPATSC